MGLVRDRFNKIFSGRTTSEADKTAQEDNTFNVERVQAQTHVEPKDTPVMGNDKEKISFIEVDKIEPSPYQPRTVFENDKLEELCQTIETHGFIQPIVVRRKEGYIDQYELIAGERRLRAAKMLDLKTIPALVKQMDDSQAASVSLIENLQREGLTVIEEALAYKNLIEHDGLTQEALAAKVGKGQSTIANKLRLLNLPSVIQDGLSERKITERHARALLAFNDKDPELMVKLYQESLDKGYTVKDLEKRIELISAREEAKSQAKKGGMVKTYLKDLRIAKNTITHSVDLLKSAGLDVETREEEGEGFYEMTIKINF